MRALAIFLVALATTSMLLPIALALPPLEDNMSFPAGSFVIPMDEKQAERVLVFGYVHALLRSPDPIQIFRVIEPPNATLSTNMTASPKLFAGGPFLVLPGDASKIIAVKNKPEFKHVTVATLTSQHTLNNIFRVREPTRILVVKGEPAWGRTDLTLDAMKIPYNLTTHSSLAANPNMIFSYSLIVIDCAGWNGYIPPQIAENIRTHVEAGNEVIFTDRALLDMNTTFPGYATLTGAQPTDKTPSAYAYNPPRKYDPTKYGSSADRFAPEYPSQYYNPGPHANEIKVFTESAGYAVSSIPSGKVNEVRILTDTKTFGPASNQYAILAFYFQYGDGIVEGLAFHPQQQVKSLVGNNGYYAVYQMYGNKFVHGPPPKAFTLEATPPSASTPQGTSFTFTITVRSFGTFNSPVSLSVATGLPPGATYVFNPPAPQPPAGGTATSAFTVTVPLTTPIGTYPMNVTGTSLTPSLQKWVLVTLNVTMAPADFQLSVSPNSLTINTTESKTAVVTVTSIGMFNENVTLNVTGLPAHVTVTFTPPAPKPPAGSTASSIMRINVGADAANGTYPLTIIGSDGGMTRSTPFTLIIVKKPVPEIPLTTLLLILALALLGIILGLAAYFLSSRRRRPPAPPVIGPVIAPPAKPQRMYVVPRAAHRVLCPQCGRPIAIEAVYCPYCGYRRVGAVAGVVTGPFPMIRGAFTGKRAVWAFVLAMASAVLILLNSAALLSPGFWSFWSGIFWWLGASSLLGQPIATLIGVIAGFTIMSGGIMMLMRRGVIGALITFPFAVLSIIIGGGFLAGAVLGIVAGILGAVGR
jgi:hypothetical protein